MARDGHEGRPIQGGFWQVWPWTSIVCTREMLVQESVLLLLRARLGERGEREKGAILFFVSVLCAQTRTEDCLSGVEFAR